MKSSNTTILTREIKNVWNWLKTLTIKTKHQNVKALDKPQQQSVKSKKQNNENFKPRKLQPWKLKKHAKVKWTTTSKTWQMCDENLNLWSLTKLQTFWRELNTGAKSSLHTHQGWESWLHLPSPCLCSHWSSFGFMCWTTLPIQSGWVKSMLHDDKC